MGWWTRARRSVRAHGAGLVAVLLVGVLACAAAAVAPLLARAIDQATLADGLAATPDADLAVRASVDVLGDGSGDPTVLPQVRETLSFAGLSGFYGPVRLARVTRDTLAFGGGNPFRARLAWREAGCGHLVAGRCPQHLGEAAVSRRDLARAGLRLGARADATSVTGARVPLRIVGVYPDPGAGDVLAPAVSGPQPPEPGAAPVLQAPVLVPAAVLEGSLPGQSQELLAQRLLVRSSVDLDTEEQVRRGLVTLRSRVIGDARGWDLDVPLLGVLDPLDRQRALVDLTLPLVGLQVVLVVWVGLALLVRALSQARADEVALAKLRGLRAGAVLRLGLGGPALALLVAVPLGWVLAVGTGHLLLGWLPGTVSRVEPGRPLVLLAVALALLGSLVALAAASAQTLRVPVASLLHRSAPPGAQVSRPLLVLEVAAVVCALVGVFQVSSGRSFSSLRGDGVGLVTPALVAVALGLVAARLGGLLLRAAGSRRLPRASVLLGSRRLASSSGVLHAAVVLVAGVAVTVSAVGLDTSAAQNRHLRAGQEVGADRVLTVRVRPGVSLLDAVRRADPSGRAAMAVEQSDDEDLAGTGRLLAVDTARYVRIARTDPAWAGLSDRALLTRLHPKVSPQVRVTGSRVRVGLTHVRVDDLGRDPRPGERQVRILLTVDDGAAWHDVDLGPAADGTLAAPLPCRSGCRVVRLRASGDGPFRLSLVWTSLATDRQDAGVNAAALHDRGRWRPLPTENGESTLPATAVHGSVDGVTASMRDPGGDKVPGISSTDTAFPLPAVVGDGTTGVSITGLPGAITGVGLDDGDQPLRQVGRATILPRLGDEGVLLDLEQASLSSDPALRPGVTHEVWLTDAAPSSVLRSLRKRGVRVVGTETAQAREDALARLGPARAAAVATGASAAALVLALLVSLATLLLGARRRLYELAALRAAGLSPAVLRRSVLVEVSGLLVAATVVGVVAGVASLRLVLPGLPLYADGGGPPRDLSTDWTAVGAVPVVTVVALALVAAVLAAGLVRAARPDRLREGLR